MSTIETRFAVAPHILQIDPYKPGKSEDELIRELGLPKVYKMASNENCLGPSSLALDAMKTAAEKTHRYPDGSGYLLRKKLSTHLNVPMEQIILGNGSTDLVETIARAYLQPGDNTITADQTFVMYRIATIAVNGECRMIPVRQFSYDLEGILRAIDSRTRVIYIANPNNPTGTMLGSREFENFLREVPPDVLVVHDEAYREYVDGDYPDSVDAARRNANLVLLRTFSKIYGLAGIRIGYGVSCEEIILNLNRLRSPFNTNSIAQAAAIAALDDTEHLRRSREHNRVERRFLETELKARHVPFVPSVTNFLLLTVPGCMRIYQAMLQQGIIARPMKSFNNQEGIRVTVGRHEENTAFLAALENAL
jgi:histidinol-phosphate aminotransferase